jgi:hypothetical protein
MADEQPRESERHLRRAEKLEQARGAVRPQRVRVLPRDDVLRKLLKHPASGGFGPAGSIEWPLDQFTKRRLRDGDVTIEQQAEPQQQTESQQPQQRQGATPETTPETPRTSRNQPPTTS